MGRTGLSFLGFRISLRFLVNAVAVRNIVEIAYTITLRIYLLKSRNSDLECLNIFTIYESVGDNSFISNYRIQAPM